MSTNVEGSLEVKLPTIWTGEKAEVGKVREELKKEAPGARKGRKVAKPRVSPRICGLEGRKVGLLKWRVQSRLAR